MSEELEKLESDELGLLVGERDPSGSAHSSDDKRTWRTPPVGVAAPTAARNGHNRGSRGPFSSLRMGVQPEDWGGGGEPTLRVRSPSAPAYARAKTKEEERKRRRGLCASPPPPPG